MKTNLSIFIVDDDPFWNLILKEMLTRLGYANINVFTSGKECTENFHLHPKLIFLDYQLEDINGLQVLHQIKKNDPFTCVVFCTAHSDLSIAIDAMKLGSADFLLKENASENKVKKIIESLHEKKAFADKIF